MQKKSLKSQKVLNEIDHGKFLAKNGAEAIWGWESAAGRIRAVRRAELISAGAKLLKDKRVLEIGCGTGNFTQIFSTTQASIIAVDISPELIEIAKKSNLPHDRVEFIPKPFEECAIDGPFDAIIGSSIIHHLDISVALHKMFSLLKPGGIISFAEPNMLNPQIAIQKNIPFIKKMVGDSPDETAFYRWQIASELKNVGFKNISVIPFDWLHPAVPKFFIGIVSAAGKILEKLPICREFSGSLLITAEKP
jgi:2-polyprenyl-3-methyl-5-hydroxy-6-metoxy-1,4-benzoquinol methylase